MLHIPEVESIERKLLTVLQREFPLVAHPYRSIGEGLGVSEGEVMALIAGLKDKGLVRQISPVVDARKLGYQSTLAAAQIPESELSLAEDVVLGHPGISHAYLRDHDFNLWFTLSVGNETDVDREVRNLGERMGARLALSLPALRLFKIGAFFGSEADGEDSAPRGSGGLPGKVPLTPVDRQIINVLQQDLPLVSSPFEGMAETAGVTVSMLLSGCRSLIDRGVIRRYGASVNHRKAGYQGNGMVCWNVPPASVEAVGNELASVREVSHCYERRTDPSWPYNLFAMFHGVTPDACRRVVDGVSQRMGLRDHLVLFSTREIKKTRVKYAA